MIFSFSTRTDRLMDAVLVKEVKAYCVEHHLNFSGLIINLLREYKQTNMGETKDER